MILKVFTKALQRGVYIMKTSKILAISAIALSLSIGNFAFAKTASKAAPKTLSKGTICAPAGFSVAIVDVQKVVESSPTINSLKTDRKNKVEDIVKFVENAKADVAKETNPTKKKALEDKYNKELNERKNAMDNAYAQSLSDVDKEITALIKSKTANYNLVLQKNIVLNGGIDVTSEIIKELK